MSDVDLGMLHDVEAELARLGLLLQHDQTLPSVTARVAGAPIAGSWWGHARGSEIYDLLVAFEAGAGALAAKLVNGKVTFVHERLWSALLTLVTSPRIIEGAGLSAPPSVCWSTCKSGPACVRESCEGRVSAVGRS